MVILTTSEFGRYLEEDTRYIYFEAKNIAYRDATIDGVDKLYAKTKGGEEKEIDNLDPDFKEATLYKTVMTQAEYEAF